MVKCDSFPSFTEGYGGVFLLLFCILLQHTGRYSFLEKRFLDRELLSIGKN